MPAPSGGPPLVPGRRALLERGVADDDEPNRRSPTRPLALRGTDPVIMIDLRGVEPRAIAVDDFPVRRHASTY